MLSLRRSLLLMAVLTSTPGAADSSGLVAHRAVFDHSTRMFTVTATSPPSTQPRTSRGAAFLTYRPGDALIVEVTSSLPGLLEAVVTRTDVGGEEGVTQQELAGIIGPHKTSPPDSSAGGPTLTNQDALELYHAVRDELGRLQRYVEADLSRVEATLAKLQEESTSLNQALGGGTSAKRVIALNKKIKNNGETEAPATFFEDLDALSEVDGQVGPFDPAALDLSRDCNITITFKSRNRLLQAPQLSATLFARHPRWNHITTTGLAFSTLFDEDFATAHDASGVAFGIKEKHSLATPEVVYLIHVFPQGGVVALTMGAGLNAGVNGRLYLGLSRLLGGTGALTIGAAGGNVKRLSRSVDLHNLNGVDPQATRRDVWDIKFAIALTLKVTT